MNLLEAATRIVKSLQDAGHAAYFAGGCVRDMLMGREPADYDIATSARPEEIHRLFEKTVAVGEEFGVVLVLAHHHRFEVATFRSDGPYTDGRHPDSVSFCDVEGDVQRRDFTINGMMLDPVEDRHIDLVGGEKDLEAGLVRAIGDPRKRFEEDRLRLVRAVRFAARLGFRIESETRSAIVGMARRILTVSWERIAAELQAMLTDASRATAVRMLDELGLLQHILPEITAMKGVRQSEEWHPEGDVFVHTLRCLEEAGEARWELVLAVLLHDVGKPAAAEGTGFALHEKVGTEMADEVCRRLRLSNREREEVVWLVKNHMRFRDARKMKESTLKRLMAEPLFEDLAELHRIDAVAAAGDLADYHFVMDRYRQFREEKPPMQPMVTGRDLIDRGLKPGPVFGEILEEVHSAQLEGQFADRDGALRFLDELLARQGLA